jgi:hypothetical protein
MIRLFATTTKPQAIKFPSSYKSFAQNASRAGMLTFRLVFPAEARRAMALHDVFIKPPRNIAATFRSS